MNRIVRGPVVHDAPVRRMGIGGPVARQSAAKQLFDFQDQIMVTPSSMVVTPVELPANVKEFTEASGVICFMEPFQSFRA